MQSAKFDFDGVDSDEEDATTSEEVTDIVDETMAYSRECVTRAKHDNTRIYRVYCDGIFDLFHVYVLQVSQFFSGIVSALSSTFIIF